ISRQSHKAESLGNGVVDRETAWEYTGPNSEGSQTVERLQKRVGVKPDGVWFEKTTRGLQKAMNRDKNDLRRRRDEVRGSAPVEDAEHVRAGVLGAGALPSVRRAGPQGDAGVHGVLAGVRLHHASDPGRAGHRVDDAGVPVAGVGRSVHDPRWHAGGGA